MKNLIYFFLLISFFSFSQEEIQVIDFASGDYPLGEKVKIYYDKDSKPTIDEDSASFFREIIFKKKNIPSGRIFNFYITGEKKDEFFANYVGLGITDTDSIIQSGPQFGYYKNSNKSFSATLFDNLLQGESKSYYESGELEYTLSYVDDLAQGEQKFYYESGELQSTRNWVDNLLQGEYKSYYQSGGLESIVSYVDDVRQGEEKGYYESGELRYTVSYVDDLAQGEQKFYYESGELLSTRNWVDDLIQGQQIAYYESRKISSTINYVGGLLNGKAINYYESGVISNEGYYLNGLAHKEFIWNYESGELEYVVSYVDGLMQGEEIGYYKTGERRYIVNYEKDLAQGERIWYYKSGKEEYRVNYVDDLKQGIQFGYYESGKEESIANYVDNLLEGKYIGYYESGKQKYILNWKNSSKQGKRIDYYESGVVKIELNYVDDLAQGLAIYYLENGDVDYSTLWVDGKIKERRIALVIGNADYDKGKLSNPVNDANLIAESLEKLDFEVFLHTNLASEGEMKDAIAEFGRKRKDYEIGFVYYAGHGIQLNNDNYLLPVKEEFNDQYDVEDNAVSMQKVLRYLESTRENQLNFIVLDACRDNPFESNWNKTRSLKGAGLAKTPPPKGSLIAFSTDHGQTAADGDGGNSLYSQTLSEKLLEENVSIEQVFKNVRTEVLKLSGDTQSPVEESKLTGDVFYLNKTEE